MFLGLRWPLIGPLRNPARFREHLPSSAVDCPIVALTAVRYASFRALLSFCPPPSPLNPRVEAGDMWCPSPVWNLGALFDLILLSDLFPGFSALSACSFCVVIFFSADGPFALAFSPQNKFACIDRL